MTEMGLRPYKELLPMRRSQVDLANELVHIPDSKTAGGVADMPMTALAKQAFEAQLAETAGIDHLFPSGRRDGAKPHLTNLRKTWARTLKKAGVPYFSLYELRHTFATRLSAGGVADHFVSQALRQEDATVFRRYSQAKLEMLRQALGRLDRRANEREEDFGTAKAS